MTFNINRHRGEVKKATTGQNKTVTRQEKLFVPEYKTFVSCAPYDEHFIYENPDNSKNTQSYLCTCGSVAVIAPPGPQGLFVCLLHATYNAHQTTFIDKDDFKGEALNNKGQKRVKKAPRKWE